MQSTASRVVLIVAAVAIVVVAFVVLNPGGDDAEDPSPTTAAEETPRDGAGGGADRAPADERPPETEPRVPVIEIENGEPVGGVEEIEAETGESLEFEVTSDAPDEIHVHGYELTEQVAPRDPARFSFVADAEGIFEVEAHDAGHVVVAELRVGPS